MKKLIYACASVAIIAAGLSLASCSGKKGEVKNFALDFGRLVTANQIDSVKLAYPGAENADSLALVLNPDSVAVEPTDKENEYKVSYGDGKYIIVNRADDGKMTVAKSVGLFAFPAEDVAFAQKTNAFKKDMSDVQRAEAVDNLPGLKALLFEQYVTARKNAITLSKMVVTKDFQYMMDVGYGYYTLTNNTDQPIRGDEYDLVWEHSYMGPMMDKTSYSTEKGRDIPANGSIKITTSFTGHGGSFLKSAKMKTPDMETFMAQYVPTGKEYDEYIKTHQPTAKGKLSDGPYRIAGKIGGKYPIHMTLDKGMKTGSYYYDKNGGTNKLSLHIISFNPRTGNIIIEERDAKGEATGIFNGTLSETNFAGKMTVTSNGKVYDYDMQVLK